MSKDTQTDIKFEQVGAFLRRMQNKYPELANDGTPLALRCRELVQENYALKEEIKRLKRDLERTRMVAMKTCILPPRGEA